jgi:hypothetical protein
MAIFKSFISTVNPFRAGGIFATRRVLVDPVTGSPVGIQTDGANGPDGVWAPVDITATQVTNPPAAMLADLNATYRLNVYPYTRYTSDGTQLVVMTPSDANYIPADGPFANVLLYAPVTITDPAGMTVAGTARIVNFAA